MDQLIEYLRENLILDFQGDLTVDLLRELLGDDESPEARALRAKLRDDRAVNDMMIVLADCLLEHARRTMTDELLREQLAIHADS